MSKLRPGLQGIMTCAVLVFLSWPLAAQSILLMGIDSRDYPLLRADILILDEDDNMRSDIQAEDLHLTENGVERTILSVSCPVQQNPQPISSVLTMDVSGSMSRHGIDLAKTAAHAWIDAFPSGTSECAISSFNHTSQLIQDFTNDKALLRSAVDGLRAQGGTSFDAAFIDELTGAIPIASAGKHRRVVVLLTDGFAGGDKEAIIDAAVGTDVRVFCVTLDQTMPDILVEIAQRTGGMYFENVNTDQEIRDIYSLILRTAIHATPCTITWESDGCDLLRNVYLGMPSMNTGTYSSYTLPESSFSALDVTPSQVVTIGAVEVGETGTATVTIAARNQPVRVSAVSFEFPEFSVQHFGGSAPPFTLAPGDSRVLTLAYTPSDAVYLACRVKLEGDACDGAWLYVVGGRPGHGEDRRVIRLLHPNGGERFVVGSDTVVTWEGVQPNEVVALDYSTDAGTTWMTISGNARGHSHDWIIPNTPSDQCLARVTARSLVLPPDGMVLIPNGTFYMGDNTGSGDMSERPAHHVNVAQPFFLSMTEVTQEEWMFLMGTNPSSEFALDHPVDQVTLLDAVMYCNARSRDEGLSAAYVIDGSSIEWIRSADGYRLPTEEEWEYACRAGNNEDFSNGLMTQSRCTPRDPNLDMMGWYCGNA
ncbi:MAG: SUMF1/EgtB/PvdO family nonheme iron enzyme, partial [Bacteroidetes bacterium]|nr:SUMF1/EgtB/PvdO family nonheme iron enzyme [Bacteroidota bacterium]